MDAEIIRRTRRRLKIRFRRVKTCPDAFLPTACKSLLVWLGSHPFLRHLIDPLRPAAGGFLTELQGKMSGPLRDLGPGPWPTRAEGERLSLLLAGIEMVASADFNETNAYAVLRMVAVAVAGEQLVGPASGVMEGSRRAFYNVAVRGLYEYLDEQIDGRNVVLGLLVKYKHRCEAFRRQRLREAAATGLEGRKGERALAFDLYEYLHDQGVDFWIESKSASGEPDLVSRDAGGERLVADAKYISGVASPSKVKQTIASGFRQVLDYCRDHNEPVGYLVVFVDRDLRIPLKADRDDGFPCFRVGDCTIYYVIVDIFRHPKTASQRPKPPVIEVTRDQLIALTEKA